MQTTTQAGLSTSLQVSIAGRSEKVAELEERRFARALHVPTDDGEVKTELRRRSVAICLFGEDAHDRRQRLRALLAQEALAGGASIPPTVVPGVEKGEVVEDEEYYTMGSGEIGLYREKIARISLCRAGMRMEGAPRGEARLKEMGEKERLAIEDARGSRLKASQRVDGRPLSGVTLFGDDKVATGDWEGVVKIWDLQNCGMVHSVGVHDGRVSMLESCGDKIITASADGSCALLRESDGKYGVHMVLRGHDGRVCAARMHRHVSQAMFTAGFDGTLRVYDADKSLAVHRTGHQRCTWLHLHPDGGLLATTGSEGGVRVWDMRCGRAVLTMERAHTGEALRVAFSGDARIFATGGADNSGAIWDLRRRGCIKRIAMHSALVSSLAFAGGECSGDLLVSASFDASMKIWCVRRDFALLAAHTVHEDKLMAIDVAPQLEVVVSACYDRTWKLWG